jgi:hypothetical protein
MSNYSVDNNRVVRNGQGQEIGKADYSGRVTDGWRDRGSIENDRYTDQYGNDQGWVKKTSSSGGGGGYGLIVILLVVGVYYLMFLGIKWLVVQGKKSTARSARSWGISALFFPPFLFLALNRGYKALNEIKVYGVVNHEEGIARAGIVLGYLAIIEVVIAIIGALNA